MFYLPSVGNVGDTGVWNSGHCSWDAGSRNGGETCSKNDDCESVLCMGNGGGLLTVFGDENAGQCAHVAGKSFLLIEFQNFLFFLTFFF